MDEASEKLIQSSKDTCNGLEPPSTSNQLHIDPAFRQCQWWYRLLPLTTLFFATLISIGIGVLWYRDYTTSDDLFELVQSDRGTVQVFIQIVSHTLGALSVFSVCTVLNYWSRSALFKRNCSLNSLRLWSALCRSTIGWNLPFVPKIGTIAFWALTLVPSAIWTGALTPRVTTQTQAATLSTPLVGIGSYSFLRPRNHDPSAEPQCWIAQQLNGTFTSCPTEHFVGKILDSASSATTSDGSARNHSKFDDTRFRYTGRSYGAGAAVGLTESDSLNASNIEQYSYMENGYKSMVNCIYNDSSAWILDPIETEPIDGAPSFLWATGWFPNSNWTQLIASPNDTRPDAYIQIDFARTGHNTVSIGSHNSDYVSRYYIAIAAGINYSELDKIQCELIFQPTSFDVRVSRTFSTITVTPTNTTCPDPEPRGILRSKVMDGLNKVSMVATSLYGSSVGGALAQNINNLQAKQFSRLIINRLDHKSAPNATILAAVSDSVAAMADDLLMSFAGAALTLPNETNLTSVMVERAAVAVGSTIYIIAIIMTNVSLLLIIATATLWTHGWAQLPVFDFTDLACMSAGLAADAARSGSKTSSCTRVLSRWNGDPRDEAIGEMAVRLLMDDESKQLSVSLRSCGDDTLVI